MSPNDTIEERLQRALGEVADSTRLSPDAWAQVERRARRRRVPRVVLAAALGVVAVAMVAVALIARDGDGPNITVAGDLETACGVAPPADVAVTLDPGATAAQLQAVETFLADHPDVSGYSFQSQEEGARIFRCVYAGEPETLSGADLAQMPSLFLVTLAAGASPAPLIQELEAQTGVTASPGKCFARADLEAYMVVGATTEDLVAARTAIEQSAGVDNVEFVTEEDAYREFACQFVAQPDLIEATAPESLPVSFRVTLEPDADHVALVQEFEGLSGVDAVIDTRYSIIVPVPGFESDEIGPSSSGYTEIAAGTVTDGSEWHLLVRTGEDGAYSALAEFNDSEVILDGVETDSGGVTEDLATGANGGTIVSFPPEVTSVDIVIGESAFPTETIPATSVGLRTRFLVARLPVGETTTLIARATDRGELYRIQTTDGEWATQP